jgi:alanine racemase
MSERFRAAWVEIDLGAVRENVAALARVAHPAAVMAVVKADGYGHGAEPVACAALDAGATWLGVALVEEGAALREAGIDAPILVLSEPSPDAAAAVVAHRLTPVVYTAAGIDALAKAVADVGAAGPLDVHLKVDTGMHRVGATALEAPMLAQRVLDRAPHLRLAGLFTHLAVADEISRPDTALQLARFDAVVGDLPDVGLVHAANSAGALAHASSRRSFVRLGIAMYGISPGPDVDHLTAELRPVLSFEARVSHVKRLHTGDRLSYGLRHAVASDCTVATVPLGYADGVRRNLSGTGTEVLIGGRRREIIGTITMDQFMVDCGDDPVGVGDEVVLIGRQGREHIRCEDWAATLGTIGYEIVCGIGARVPRRFIGSE